ncbi:hypothetical protein BKA70DRAFT_1440655 [Coprinopsis sp. MPI-PUGE-AT-0042]|nr:hypothetical protein BKA70DRAFT_1440655 [Coprinopsis sp. MPI-PUGE-AT-0042]
MSGFIRDFDFANLFNGASLEGAEHHVEDIFNHDAFGEDYLRQYNERHDSDMAGYCQQPMPVSGELRMPPALPSYTNGVPNTFSVVGFKPLATSLAVAYPIGIYGRSSVAHTITPQIVPELFTAAGKRKAREDDDLEPVMNAHFKRPSLIPFVSRVSSATSSLSSLDKPLADQSGLVSSSSTSPFPTLDHFEFTMPLPSTTPDTSSSSSLVTTPNAYEPTHLNWKPIQSGSPMVYLSQEGISGEMKVAAALPPIQAMYPSPILRGPALVNFALPLADPQASPTPPGRQQIICQWNDDCKEIIEATVKAVTDHIAKRHCPEGIKPAFLRCQWTSHRGGRCSGQDAKIGRHILTKCHVLTMPNGEEFELKEPCSRCGKVLNSQRPDSIRRHFNNGTCAKQQDKNRNRKAKAKAKGEGKAIKKAKGNVC